MQGVRQMKVLFTKLKYWKRPNIFCLAKALIFKLNCKVGKGERNDKMTRKSKSKAHYINEKFNRWWFFENDKFCFCEMTFVIGINPTQHHVVERFLNVLLLLVSSEYSYSALHFSLGYTQKVFDKNPMQHQNEVVLNLLIMPPPSSWVQFCGLACRHQCSF